MDHFGPGIDLLDINTDGENVVNFTCFTEKQVSVNNEGKPQLLESRSSQCLITFSCIEETTPHVNRGGDG